MKQRRKSTMPAIIDNQPFSWYWGDGAKSIAESQKNQRNKENLIRKAEQPAKTPKTKPANTKPLVRSKTRVNVYPRVRTINN